MDTPRTCPASSGVTTNNRHFHWIRFHYHSNLRAIGDEPFCHCCVHRAYFTLAIARCPADSQHSLTLSSCEPTHTDGGCFQVSVYVYLFYYNRFTDFFYYLIVLISLLQHATNSRTTAEGAPSRASPLKASKTAAALAANILLDSR